MANFIEAYKKLNIAEGGYSNRAADRGGETYAGISRKWYPNFEGWPIVDALKAGGYLVQINQDPELAHMAEKFYLSEYWKPLGCDKITDQTTAYEILEMAVNLGAKVTVKKLQQALNVLNRCATNYPDIEEDGEIGPETLKAVEYWKTKPQALIRTLNGLQFAHYFELCKKDPSQEANFGGWLTRT